MRNLTIFEMVLYLLFWSISSADTACLPVFTRKTTDTLQRGDNVVFLCEILSCKTLSRVIYEKTDVTSPSIWMPVYEAINISHHHALATGSGYTLNGRAEHSNLDTHFLFKLLDVSVKDNGRWRCVVVDNLQHKSIALPLAVLPEQSITIRPVKPELVTNQSETFTCKINGIYPEPNIEWILNGTKHRGNTTLNEQRDDGLWYAINTAVQLDFDAPGKTVLICALTTQNGDSLVDTNITIDVKASAKITYPTEELLITPNDSSSVVLTCSGSGYTPRITWQRNGIDIRSDNQRRISSEGNSSTCASTLILKQIDPPSTCTKVQEFTGEYTCTVIVGLPYKSKQTSKRIKVKLLHKPLLTEDTQTIFAEASETVTLTCEVCTETNITSEWTLNGEILQGDHVEQQQDGSVSLTGYHPSGAYNRTVRNSIGSTSCIVHLVNADGATYRKITYLVLGVLGASVTILILWQVRNRRKKRQRFQTSRRPEPNRTENEECRELLSDMNSPKYRKGFTTKVKSWCIWGSTDFKSVFVGGQDSPSISVIKELANQTTHLLSTGTNIVYGLFIKSTVHLINVYDNASKKHFIYCVSIDSTAEQLTPRYTLQLSDEIIEPRCMFAIDNSSIGIYCAKKLKVEVFNTDNILSYTSHVNIIRLTGFDSNENDSLCVNTKGHICVLSYKLRNVYIYDKRGEYIYNFNTNMWLDPVHIHCLSDNSFAVVTVYGEIRQYDVDREPKITKLGTNTYIQAVMFTGSLLWVVDAIDSTKIHVYTTGIE